MAVTEESVKAKWNANARSEINVHDALLEREGYITIGYYKPDTTTLGQSMENMPLRIAEIGEINSASKVLDLGCGKGRPLLDVAVKTGCSVVGVDLADGHIEIAQRFKDKYLLEHPTLKAEFFTASYFELPAAVTEQSFTHVVMQTSLFYNHHKIDQLLSSVSSLLTKDGKMLTTDFLRIAPAEEVAEFLTFNSMTLMLSMEEMKQAFARNGMEYSGGEDLDDSCVKCNTMKKAKALELGYAQLNPAFFDCRRSFVESHKVTFQLVMAQKM